jgi:hypothetical protein
MKIEKVIDGMLSGEVWTIPDPVIVGLLLNNPKAGRNFLVDDRGRIIQFLVTQ